MEFREVAEQVVTKSLRIRAGDSVFIDAWEHTLAQAEAMAAACIRAGARPTVHFFSDALFRTVLTDAPADLLRTPSPVLLAAFDHVTAAIYLSGPKDPAIFEAASPARGAMMNEGDNPLSDKSRQRKIRTAWIATAFATPERARQYGIDHAAWQRSVNEALTVDPTELAAVGGRVAAILREGKQVRITAPPGTDLTVNLIGRTPHLEDGVIDDQDLAVSNHHVVLPTGTVAVAPDERSANGTVTFPFAALWGKVIRDLRFMFGDGRLTSFTARENEATLRGFYEGATGDKDRLGSISLGINSRAASVGGGNLTDWLSEGAVSIGLGKNKGLGGELDSSFHWFATLSGARVEVDGRVIAENGRVLV